MDQNNSSNPTFTSATAAPLPQGNSDEFIPHPGMYMGQMPWPVYFPQVPQLNDTAPFSDASASQHNEGPAGVPPHVPVASSSVAGAGNASNSYQAVQPPFSVVNIGNATYNQAFLNPYPPQPGVAIPPQYQFVPAPQYNQASFPSGAFSGAMQPQIYGVPSYIPFPIQNTHLQQHGAGLVSTFSLPPQATAPATGSKRGAKGFEDREETKKVKLQSGILRDPNFEPTTERDENGHQRFKCLRCNILIIKPSYKKHIEIGKHRGDGKGSCPCYECGKLLSRRDALKRHKEGHVKERIKREMQALASGSSQSSMTPFSSVAVPTVPFTFPEPMPVRSMPSVSPAPNMGNVQMAPLAKSSASDTGNVQLPLTDAVTQSFDTSIFPDLFQPVPGSSESSDTAGDNIDYSAVFSDPAMLANFVTMLDDAISATAQK